MKEGNSLRPSVLIVVHMVRIPMAFGEVQLASYTPFLESQVVRLVSHATQYHWFWTLSYGSSSLMVHMSVSSKQWTCTEGLASQVGSGISHEDQVACCERMQAKKKRE